MDVRALRREETMSHPSAKRTIRHVKKDGSVIYISPAQAKNFEEGAMRFEEHHYSQAGKKHHHSRKYLIEHGRY